LSTDFIAAKIPTDFGRALAKVENYYQKCFNELFFNRGAKV
jgi:hypothetical protein